MIFAATLPENSNDGYVAAAYIVFFVLLLVYIAIVAWRLARVERSVRDLRAREGGKDVRRREGALNHGGEAKEIETAPAGDPAHDGEGQTV